MSYCAEIVKAWRVYYLVRVWDMLFACHGQYTHKLLEWLEGCAQSEVERHLINTSQICVPALRGGRRFVGETRLT